MNARAISIGALGWLCSFAIAAFAEELGAVPIETSTVISGNPAPLSHGWEKRSAFLRGRIFHSAVWTYSEMIVWGGGANHEFYNDGGIYDPVTDKWRAVTQEGAPSGRWGHAAVWTGSEMIIWGGRSAFSPSQHYNDGAIFDPETNRWRPMSNEGAPSPRSQMAAVWTGDELIVWGGWADGGQCPATGARYSPRDDRWMPLPLDNAPEGRIEPAHVWTGRELIVWGGLLPGETTSAASGARFDPETQKWKPLPTENAPLSARGLQAFWTGSEMVLWGGAHLDGTNLVNIGRSAGARYNPVTDAWRATPLEGAPDGRLYYAGVWTGSEVLFWGGGDQKISTMRTGGRYSPDSDRWLQVPADGAPEGRSFATAVWTGEGALVFGGSTGGSDAFNETLYYKPPAAK